MTPGRAAGGNRKIDVEHLSFVSHPVARGSVGRRGASSVGRRGASSVGRRGASSGGRRGATAFADAPQQ